jgi:hypothetical protein
MTSIIQLIITPSVLISALGLLILSTANRYGRLFDRIDRTAQNILSNTSPEELKIYYKKHLPLLKKRAGLLYFSMQSLYFSLFGFIAACFALAVEFYLQKPNVISTMAIIWGVFFLFIAAGLLAYEIMLSKKSIEINFELLDENQNRQ